MSKLFAGTSGFAYPAWKPDFYPEKLAQKQFLHHYSTRLNAVEVNYTFRRLLTPSVIEGWVAQTNPGFVFVIKAHQRITHFNRLEPSEFVEVFFRSIDGLRIKGQLGPVLFQLPPNLPADPAKLAEFLKLVPEDVRCAFEFRHKSWLGDEIYELLAERNVALCLAESDKLVVPERITADFVYFRLRKADYPEAERAEIAGRVARLRSDAKDVYVFFKHEDTPAGAIYAEDLLRG